MRRNARMSCSGSRPSWIAADADWATVEVVATDGGSPSTSLIEKRGRTSAKGKRFRVMRRWGGRGGRSKHSGALRGLLEFKVTQPLEESMRKLLLSMVLSVLAQTLFAQGAPPQGAADQPYTLEYYYKVQWGHQQEFLQLFLKNHYPLLQKIVASGRMISVKIEQPSNHMTEDARWDYRVTIRFKN